MQYHYIEMILIYILTAVPVAVPPRRRLFSESSRGLRTPMATLSSSPKDFLPRSGKTTPSEECIPEGELLHYVRTVVRMIVHIFYRQLSF